MCYFHCLPSPPQKRELHESKDLFLNTMLPRTESHGRRHMVGAQYMYLLSEKKNRNVLPNCVFVRLIEGKDL